MFQLIVQCDASIENSESDRKDASGEALPARECVISPTVVTPLTSGVFDEEGTREKEFEEEKDAEEMFELFRNINAKYV